MIQADYNIADNLPESLNRENLQQVAQLIDAKMHELNVLSELVFIYPRIDELSSALVDALAIQFHVDFYDTGLPLDKRRALVKNSVRWHMRKGTAGVVQELVQTVFDSGVVKEWFEYDGEPYHFRVDLLSAPQMTLEDIDLVVRVINTVKNVRSWLDGLGYQRNITANRYYGTVISGYTHFTISPAQPKDASLAVERYYMGGMNAHKNIVITQHTISDYTLSAPRYSAGVSSVHKHISINEEDDSE